MKILPFGIAPLRPSIRFMLIRTCPWLLLFFGFIAGTVLVHPLLIIASWLVLLGFLYHVFLLCAELYVISPEMFMVSTGILNKTVTWLEPLQIKAFNVHQSKLMQYLNIAHVTVVSDDDINIKFTLKGVDNKAMKEALGFTMELIKTRHEYLKRLIDMAEKATANQK